MSQIRNCRNSNSRPLILCPCPTPRRILTSANWISRNDSSSISAILHPDNFWSPRLKIDEKTKGDVQMKHILSSNDCYCREKDEKRPKPTFFKRPNSCISYQVTSKYDIEQNDHNLKKMSLKRCVCEDNEDTGVSSVGTETLRSRVMKLKQAKSAPTELGLEYTDQRKEYEEYRRNEEDKAEEKIREYEEESEKIGEGPQDLTTTTLSHFEDMDISLPEHAEETTDKYPDNSNMSVPDFRKQYYFETHDIGKMDYKTDDGKLKDHKCVHQMKLDKRQMPEPVNKDSFGRSLCKICDRPMEGSTINLRSGLFSGENISRNRIKSYAETMNSGLSSTTINLGRGKSQIELILSSDDLSKLSDYISKAKKPQYRNSLALRHQKMRQT